MQLEQQDTQQKEKEAAIIKGAKNIFIKSVADKLRIKSLSGAKVNDPSVENLWDYIGYQIERDASQSYEGKKELIAVSHAILDMYGDGFSLLALSVSKEHSIFANQKNIDLSKQKELFIEKYRPVIELTARMDWLDKRRNKGLIYS
ncbi:hypothetical protein [Acinetobacter sp. P1(2025)]|uniref:hypothetical protein n=1 Tax=Acinetobacter sp. P1(2025) TaxID=3446120 RepID=UPI003F52EC56